VNRTLLAMILLLSSTRLWTPAIAGAATSHPRTETATSGSRDSVQLGLELGLRGLWFLQLQNPISDTLSQTDQERDRSDLGASAGIDLEGGVSLGNHASILLRFGYKGRFEDWQSPDPLLSENMDMVYSLVHLPSINIKWRPWYKRVSMYLTGGGGIDLMVFEPTIGVAQRVTLREPGGGLNAGLGLDLFVTSKFAVVLDLRYNLSLHGTDIAQFPCLETMDTTGELCYDLSFAPTHHALSLGLGIMGRP
jgi:hypothetical protein